MRTFLFFLLFPLSLFLANDQQVQTSSIITFSGSPGADLGSSVNVTSGDYYVSEIDYVVPGVEPISIKRTYHTGAQKNLYTSLWNLYPHLSMKIHWSHKKKEPHKIWLHEDCGSLFFYESPWHKKPIDLHFKLNLGPLSAGYSNESKKGISAKTNATNHKIFKKYTSSYFIQERADGGKRWYRYRKNSISAAFLEKEQKPNGNFVCYEYSDSYRIKKIFTQNPSQTLTYAWIEFHYHEDFPTNCSFEIKTSDGKTFSYNFKTDKVNKDVSETFLNSIKRPDYFDDGFDYKRLYANGPKVPRARSKNGNAYVNLEYYLPSEVDKKVLKYSATQRENFKQNHNVKKLRLPTGPGGKFRTIYSLKYHYAADHFTKYHQNFGNISHTTVTDAENFTRVFKFNHSLKPYEISLSKDDKLITTEHITYWPNYPERVQCKAFYDKKQLTYLNDYFYDEWGNVKKTRLIGKITGQKAFDLSFIFFKKYVENDDWIYFGQIYGRNAEQLVSTFEYYDPPFHNLKKEIHPKKTYLYAYVPETNLKLKKLTLVSDQVKKRVFYRYDKNNLLISETTDDGCGHTLKDTAGIKQRFVTQYTRKTAHPALGYPEIIEKKYFDPKSSSYHLQKKVVLFYDKSCNVIKEDHYDANNTFRYSIKRRYNARNQLTFETDPLGRKSFYTYDDLGRCSQENLGNQKFIKAKTFDILDGELTESIKTDHATYTKRFERDLKHRVKKTVDHKGIETLYHFDEYGFNAKEDSFFNQSEKGAFTRASTGKINNFQGKPLIEKDALGRERKYEYNAFGKPLKIIHPDQTVERFTYTLQGNLASHTLQDGSIHHYEHDYDDRLIKKTWKSSNGKTLREEHFEYDAFHLKKHIDFEGKVTRFSYNHQGQLVEEKITKDQVLISHKTYRYDPLGRQTQTKEHGSGGYRVISKTYDLGNRILSEHFEDETGKTFSYQSYTYDAYDNKLSESKKTKHGLATESFEYDYKKRITKITSPLGRVTTIAYDDFFRFPRVKGFATKKTTTDPKQNKTIEIFDQREKLLEKKILSENSETLSKEEFYYDLVGNKLLDRIHVYQDGVFKYIIENRFQYDAMNRLISQTESARSDSPATTKYSYTKKGLRKTLQKPNGVTFTYKYDQLDRLIKVSSSAGDIAFSLEYDASDNLIKETDLITKKCTERVFDVYGNVVMEKQNSGLNISYSYDEWLRPVSISLPDSSEITYTYDTFHLLKITRTKDKDSYTHTIDEICPSHKILKETLPFNAGSVTHNYDAEGTKCSMDSPYTTLSVNSFDELKNPLQIDIQTPYKKNINKLKYDKLGHITEETYPLSRTYAYDSIHNRTEKNHSPIKLSKHNQPLEFEQIKLEYDTCGNRIKQNEMKLEYDSLDRLIAVYTTDFIYTYSYDYSNRRTETTFRHKKAKEPTSFYYLYDKEAEIANYFEGKPLQVRIPKRAQHSEIANSIAFEIQGNTYLPFYDLFGSVIALGTPYHPNSFWESSYSAFGERENHIRTPLSNPYGYLSKRRDLETGFVFFGRRYYDPTLGTWLTKDPKGLDEGPSLYAYSHGAPYSNIDIWGLSAEAREKSISDLDHRDRLYINTRTTLNSLRDTEFYLGNSQERYQYHLNKSIQNALDNKYTYSDHGMHSQVFEKPALENPIKGHKIIAINGILTDSNGALDIGNSIQQRLPRMPMSVIHNSTYGPILDILGAAVESYGFDTHAVKLTRETIMQSLHDQNTVHIMAHSRGAAVVRSAVHHHCFKPHRDKINIYTFGGPVRIAKNAGKNVINYVSLLDPVGMVMTKMTPKNSHLQELLGNIKTVYLKPSQTNPIQEHYFSGDTYQEALESLSIQIRGKTGL